MAQVDRQLHDMSQAVHGMQGDMAVQVSAA